MANRIANGVELSKQSWNALRQNRQLLWFPLISGITMLFVSIFFALAVVGSGVLSGLGTPNDDGSNSQTAVGVVIAFLYYFVSYTVIIFSNVALVGAVMKLLRGEPATVSDGIAIASARIGKIIVYSLISATIGMLARGIAQAGRNSDNIVVAILTAIVGSIIQGAWNLVVFFAIPVLVVEDIGVVGSLTRSFEIFKETWGESFVGRTVIGGASCLVYLAVFLITALLVAIGITLESPIIVIAAIVLAVVVLIALSLITGAVNGIFQASLYKYATTGDAGPFISNEYAAAAFQTR